MILLGTSGCGNAVDLEAGAGLAGMSVTADGDLVINAYVCNDYVDVIDVARDRAGLKETEENPLVRDYKSASHLTGDVTINLDHPGGSWTPSAPLVLEAGKGYLVTAQGSGDDANETSQVDVYTDRLKELEPGGIYTSEGVDTVKYVRHSPAGFKKLAQRACDF